MDQSFIKAIEEHVGTGVKIIDKNTKFQFICDGCRDGSSRCCCNRGDERIIINPYDVYKLQKGLGKTSAEIIEKYTEIISGAQSGIPMFLLTTKTLFNGEEICPFIKKKVFEEGKPARRYCSVHEFKPSVCSIFPLGRVQAPGEEMVYILQNVNCGLKPKADDPEITISDMVPDLENADKAFSLYHAFLQELTTVISCSDLKNSKKLPEQIKEMFCVTFLYMLCDFTSERDYFEQFEENCKKVIGFVKESVEVLSEFDKSIRPKPVK